MNTKKALGWWLSISLVALAAPSIIGCGGVVAVGGGSGDELEGAGGDGGDGAGGGIADPAGGAGGGAPQAIAMTWAQLDAAWNGGSGGSGSATTAVTGGGPDPATQFLMFGGGTEAPTCTAPNGNGQCGGWSVSVRIAPYLFQPGVVSFASPDLDITFSESADEGNGQCSGGGGGGFEEGTLEIVEITPTTVHFVVDGVSSFIGEDPNGERVATRCP